MSITISTTTATIVASAYQGSVTLPSDAYNIDVEMDSPQQAGQFASRPSWTYHTSGNDVIVSFHGGETSAIEYDTTFTVTYSQGTTTTTGPAGTTTSAPGGQGDPHIQPFFGKKYTI